MMDGNRKTAPCTGQRMFFGGFVHGTRDYGIGSLYVVDRDVRVSHVCGLDANASAYYLNWAENDRL
jgi:hypothetical protein